MKLVLKKLFYFLEDSFYRLRPVELSSGIKIRSTAQTLEEVIRILASKQKGAYLRFGDGDVNLLHNRDELLQGASSQLAEEMKQAFSLSGEGVIKCLPLHSKRFGQEKGMKPGLHSSSDRWAENILRRCYEYFIGDYIYSHVALAYSAVFEREKALEFLRYLKTFNPVFVGNENVPSYVIENLFGKTTVVKTPAKGSFGEIDRIETETKAALSARGKAFDVVIVAMGCSGRILEKRILANYPEAVFLFDFGSLLDVLSGQNTRAWMGLTELPAGYWQSFLNKINL